MLINRLSLQNASHKNIYILQSKTGGVRRTKTNWLGLTNHKNLTQLGN